MTTFYKGISLKSYEVDKAILLRDVEIVKQDLLNNIFTSKGERLMMPKYGTSLRELMFQPLDQDTLALIEVELLGVFNNDPRVVLLDISVNPIYEEKAVVVIAELRYLEINFNDTLEIRLNFDG